MSTRRSRCAIAVASIMAPFLFILIAALAISGCNSCRSRTTTTTTTQTNATTAQVSKYILHANDFDLKLVMALITSGTGMNDMSALEQKINDPASGINNVDIDKDGKIDYVSAKESTVGGQQTIEFEAHPSGSADAEPVVIASVNVSQNTTTNQVTVSGGHPTYVDGYDSAYYSNVYPRSHFADAMFMYWMLRPHPLYAPRYYGAYPMGYVPRPVLAPTVVQSQRTNYQTTTRVSPVPQATRPSNYSSPSVKQDTANRVQSKYATPPQNGAGSIKGNAQNQNNYKERDTSKPKAQGGSFSPNAPKVGSPPATPPKVASPPPSPPSTPKVSSPPPSPPKVSSPPPSPPRVASPPPSPPRASPPRSSPPSSGGSRGGRR